MDSYTPKKRDVWAATYFLAYRTSLLYENLLGLTYPRASSLRTIGATLVPSSSMARMTSRCGMVPTLT